MTATDEVGAPDVSADGQTETYCRLRLYIAGQTPKSLQAMANLKRLCAAHLDMKYDIEIIDLLLHPRMAATDDIVAIPTLVRRAPEPTRKIIGDLSSAERVILGLQLHTADG